MDSSCCICAQIDGRRENDLISLSLDEENYVRRIAMENATFAVIPSLGPIVPGHTLLCPKEHLKSFSHVARLGEQNPGLHHQYSQIVADLADTLKACYSKPIHIFEHGSAIKDGRVLCTVDHAHLHLVPTDIQVAVRLRRSGLWTPIGSTLTDLAKHVAETEYLYYLAPDGEALVCVSPNGFESQWMRRLFCDELGVSHRWNWREELNPTEADACYQVLQATQKKRAAEAALPLD